MYGNSHAIRDHAALAAARQRRHSPLYHSHTATDGGATTSAIYCRTPSIRCARHHGLELLAGRPTRTAGL